MNAIVLINLFLCIYILFSCAHTSKQTPLQIQLQKEKSNMMQLLTIIRPFKRSMKINSKENNEDFNKNLVEPLNDYLFLTHSFINSIKNQHDDPNIITHVIENITLDDNKIGQLLQYYYYQSNDISEIFKIYWFYIDVKRIWLSYSNSKKQSIENFKILIEETIYSFRNSSKIKLEKKYKTSNNPKDKLLKIKTNLYKLSESKKKLMKNKYVWLTIKQLSMDSFMHTNEFYKLYTTTVIYKKKYILLKDTYNTILSTMNMYALLKLYYISIEVIIRQFNKFLINIFLTYSKLYNLMDNMNDLDDIHNFIKLSIKSSIMFFKRYFIDNIQTLYPDHILQMYQFIEFQCDKKDTTNIIEYHWNLFRKTNNNSNSKTDSNNSKKFTKSESNKDKNHLKESRFYKNEFILSNIYEYLAKNASEEHNNVNKILDEDESTSSTYDDYKTDMRAVFEKSVELMNTLTATKSQSQKIKNLQSNLLHMSLNISVYTCLIAKQLNIKSKYIIYKENINYEFDNINYKQNPELLETIINEYLSGAAFLDGSKIPPINNDVEDKYFVICEYFYKDKYNI